jgi:ketosteroid isomerase-like protein
MNTTEQRTLELGRRWAAAEEAGDVSTLDSLAVDDFMLVGPFGFVLDKGQWLARYGSGQLSTSQLKWCDVVVREYGDVVVAVGVADQKATFNQRPADGMFRSTHVMVYQDGALRLAGIHFSPLAEHG